jgi:hypothetical protein
MFGDWSFMTWYTIAVIIFSFIYAIVMHDPDTFYESLPGYAFYDLGRKVYSKAKGGATAASQAVNS